MTHVLVACHAWYGDMVGGSFRLASEFAEYLASRGHRVSYVCCATSTASRAGTESRPDGLRIERYAPPTKPLGGISRLRFHMRESARLAMKVHGEVPVDVISGHSPLQALGAMRALRGKASFANYTVHSPFDDELLSNAGERPSVSSRVAAFVAGRVDGRNGALADRVQCDSQYTLTTMQHKHRRQVGEKGIVAPGWVDASRFLPAGDRRELRQRLGGEWRDDDDGNQKTFFTLRRLESRMGLDTLVAACQILAGKGLRFRTLIGGGGSLRESLQRQIDAAGIADKVVLLGRLPEEQLADCYAAADCFVLPTKALECFGLIVLEAFACNTPVIAADVAAIPELARGQGDGWMFPPGDARQLADRMESFLAGRLSPEVELRQFAERYDKPSVLNRWESLLGPTAVASSRGRTV